MKHDRFLTHSLRDPRVARILAKALESVEPGALVTRYLQSAGLPPHKRIFLLAFGKAAEPMASAAADFIGDFDGALAITKHMTSRLSHPVEMPIPFESLAPEQQRRLRIFEAGHPIPDSRSLTAGTAVLKFASQLRADDLLVCLISGGGSSLVAAPSPGVSLTDLKMLTTALLASGATVEEMNILRRKLDHFKGGGLTAACQGRIVSLILSDVIGDDLAAVASGPTVAEPTCADEAISVLRKYAIETPPSVLVALRTSTAAHQPNLSERVHNVLIGNSSVATGAARVQAQQEGLDSTILDTVLHGEASVAGPLLARTLMDHSHPASHPFCLIAGGETTVTLHGPGRGGRNQELALAAVDILGGLHNLLLVTLATDGEDGPTDAAGAVVSGETCLRATEAGMRANEFLSRNDAYSFFDALGDLLKLGYTGTNVNDIVLLCHL